MSAQRVNVGILGLGRSGWSLHFKVIQQLADLYNIAAVSDPVKERRKEAQHEVQCEAFEDVQAVIQHPEIDLIVVATPSHTHADLACQAMEAGKHVLVEKPMAVNVVEADRMVNVAQRTNRLLTVYQLRRLDPDYLKVKEIIQSGILGPIALARLTRHNFRRRNDWQTLLKYGGGMLNNWGSHIVDQGLQLLGEPPVQVFADMQKTVSVGDAEDHIKVTMKGKEGMTVDVEVTSCSAFPHPEWLVVGAYGSLQGTTRELTYKYYDPKDLPALRVEEGPAEGRSYGKPENVPWQEKHTTIDASKDVKILFYNALYKSIRYGEPLLVTPESVREQIALFDECRRQNNFASAPSNASSAS